tara:strand:- start:108 stop:338 length:231 start_codon:yes stop_codon:yes gene_type:complete
MWNYTCYLCDRKDSDDYLCETCRGIKKIIACYNETDILETLENVYLRDKEKCEGKAEVEKTKMTTRNRKKDQSNQD